MTFNPTLLVFNDFYGKELELIVSVSDNAPDGLESEIYLEKVEKDKIFYVTPMPIPIKISKLDPLKSKIPTITIGNIETDTTGYPITVPVTVSDPPSNLMYMHIEIVGDDVNHAV